MLTVAIHHFGELFHCSLFFLQCQFLLYYILVQTCHCFSFDSVWRLDFIVQRSFVVAFKNRRTCTCLSIQIVCRVFTAQRRSYLKSLDRIVAAKTHTHFNIAFSKLSRMFSTLIPNRCAEKAPSPLPPYSGTVPQQWKRKQMNRIHLEWFWKLKNICDGILGKLLIVFVQFGFNLWMRRR